MAEKFVMANCYDPSPVKVVKMILIFVFDSGFLASLSCQTWTQKKKGVENNQRSPKEPSKAEIRR
ncbi:MAG: hypothetical protein QNJ41_28365 [Xenococcaceae cyanobacterium MO_188.B32]|nr:hypothetical protein [Xenococcaceae cyanobacterium MO_188.B32]